MIKVPPKPKKWSKYPRVVGLLCCWASILPNILRGFEVRELGLAYMDYALG